MRLAIMALAAGFTAVPAQAAVTIDIRQVGDAVVATGWGTLNIGSLRPTINQLTAPSGVNPGAGLIRLGATGPFDYYNFAIRGPRGFGTGGYVASPLGTGDIFGVLDGDNAIYLPPGYRSGDALRGTTTFRNATIASLGLDTGTFVYALDADSITVNIGGIAGAVPEPAGWALMIAGFGAVGGAMRRRQAMRAVIA